MRTIERTGAFRRDYKREAKGQHKIALQTDLVRLLAFLVNDQSLETNIETTH